MTGPATYRGQRLGLPSEGRGSIASAGARAGAFLVDCVASALVAGGFVMIFGDHTDTASRFPGTWSLIPFAVDYIVGLLVAGRTVGMYLVGLRVIRVDRDAAITPLPAIVRTVLLGLLIPAMIWDRDARGLHDRFTDTAVVRA
ncbi:MAG: RDD family protein [Actinomycetota bacterium]